MLDALNTAWQGTSQLEVISVVFGLAYVILAARENILCWPAALIGTGTGIFLFWDVSLVMESALNVYYLLMAVYGWWQWQRVSESAPTIRIRSWCFAEHIKALTIIVVLTAIFGFFLSGTDAAYPFIDSFTTWAAVITTYMVTRKILENWLYWIVIDIISVWLFVQKELYLYALLFIIYTVIALFGYCRWRKNLVNAQATI